jgi:hypothetical protein
MSQHQEIIYLNLKIPGFGVSVLQGGMGKDQKGFFIYFSPRYSPRLLVRGGGQEKAVCQTEGLCKIIKSKASVLWN